MGHSEGVSELMFWKMELVQILAEAAFSLLHINALVKGLPSIFSLHSPAVVMQ